MKKNIIIVASVATVLLLATGFVRPDFLGIGKAFKKMGNAIADTAKKAGNAIADVAKKAGKEIVSIANKIAKFAKAAWKKIAECGEALGLKTALVAEEAGYEIAKAGIEVGKAGVELAKAGVSSANASLVAAEATEKGLLEAANKAQQGVMIASDAVQQGAMEAASGTLYVTSKMLELGAVALAKGINIRKCYVKSAMKDWPAGKLPLFTIEGVMFGKSFKVAVQPKFEDIGQMFVDLFNKIF